MITATCLLSLYLPGVRSLKEKRSSITSLRERARRRFNISIAEVDAHDLHARCVLGIACVARTGDHARRQVEALLAWIETERPDLTILDADVELL